MSFHADLLAVAAIPNVVPLPGTTSTEIALLQATLAPAEAIDLAGQAVADHRSGGSGK
jgi:hypothetical protein